MAKLGNGEHVMHVGSKNVLKWPQKGITHAILKFNLFGGRTVDLLPHAPLKIARDYDHMHAWLYT